MKRALALALTLGLVLLATAASSADLAVGVPLGELFGIHAATVVPTETPKAT